MKMNVLLQTTWMNFTECVHWKEYMLEPSIYTIKNRATWVAQWLSVCLWLRLWSQLLGSWDLVLHQAPYREPASPSASASVCVCVSGINKYLKKKQQQKDGSDGDFLSLGSWHTIFCSWRMHSFVCVSSSVRQGWLSYLIHRILVRMINTCRWPKY